MPQQITKLRIFVASPSDVSDERGRVKRVVEELNGTLGNRENLFLEYVGWEKDAWPGFGDDAQAVINQRIGQYDIFVGIMWRRLGTPTRRSASGTTEEFERAYEVWRTHRRPAILFYFKKAPFTPGPEDPEQLRGVYSFKKLLGEKGGLYWEYEDPNEFEQMVRAHLYKQVAELIPQPEASAPALPLVGADAAAVAAHPSESASREAILGELGRNRRLKKQVDLLRQCLKADEKLIAASGMLYYGHWMSQSLGVLAVTSRRLVWVYAHLSSRKVRELPYDQIIVARAERYTPPSAVALLGRRTLVISAWPKGAEFADLSRDWADKLAALINKRVQGKR